MKIVQKTQYTTITPLPRRIPRQLAIDTLHSHSEVIELNPLVIEHHPVKVPATAPAGEHSAVWHEITERIQNVRVTKGKVSFKGVFHDMPWGLQTHLYLPMGVEESHKWIIRDYRPGEQQGRSGLGVGAPWSAGGLCLQEDIEIACAAVLTPLVRNRLKAQSTDFIARLLKKVESLDLDKRNPETVSQELQYNSKQILGDVLTAAGLYDTCLCLYVKLWNVCRHHLTHSPGRRAQVRDYLGSLLLCGDTIAGSGSIPQDCLDRFPDIRDSVFEVLLDIGKTLTKSTQITEVRSGDNSVASDHGNNAAVQNAALNLKALLDRASLLKLRTEEEIDSDTESYLSEDDGLPNGGPVHHEGRSYPREKHLATAQEGITGFRQSSIPGPNLGRSQSPDPPPTPIQPADSHAKYRLQLQSGGQRRKPVRVARACDPCRQRKYVCDEDRPKCHRCMNDDMECFYKDIPSQEHVDGAQKSANNLETRPDKTVSGSIIPITSQFRASEPAISSIFPPSPPAGSLELILPSEIQPPDPCISKIAIPYSAASVRFSREGGSRQSSLRRQTSSIPRMSRNFDLESPKKSQESCHLMRSSPGALNAPFSLTTGRKSGIGFPIDLPPPTDNLFTIIDNDLEVHPPQDLSFVESAPVSTSNMTDVVSPSSAGNVVQETARSGLPPNRRFGGVRFCEDMASHIACLQELGPTLEQILQETRDHQSLGLD